MSARSTERPAPAARPPTPFGPPVGWWRHSPVVVALGGYLVVLAWLTLSAAGSGTLRWDVPVQRATRQLDGTNWDAVAALGNWLGLTGVGLVLLTVVAIPLLIRRRLPEAALLGGVALIRSLNWPLKWLIDSPRPFTTDHRTNDVANGLGYPSGHAMGTMLIGGALVLVAFRLTGSRGVRAIVSVVVVAALLATGFGRVVTRAHWPSDVLGGWLWGLGLLGVVVLLVSVADRRWFNRLPVPGGGRQRAVSRLTARRSR